jgi:hypothetical protein
MKCIFEQYLHFMTITPQFQIIKTVFKLTFLALIITTYGCESRSKADKSDIKTLYSAVNKTDTARFNIKLTDKEFYGQLEINYRGLYKDSGDVTGIVKGDTLKGTFRFQHYGIENWHTIPIALLKKDNKLIMGEGAMEIYMGIYYFKKNMTIDYQAPKFIFQKL